jgi:periplasmic divalent cation tolerance protein
VEVRLAACANIEGPVISVYEWDGKVLRDEEHILWLKTRAGLWVEIERFISAHHSFDTPAILAMPCFSANARYEAWLLSNCKAD